MRSSQSAANATTRLSPTELEAYFGQQLEGAGWQRQAGRAEGPLAWSIWQVPMGGEQGFLLVLVTSQDQRFLYLRVDTAGQDGPRVFSGRWWFIQARRLCLWDPSPDPALRSGGGYRLEEALPVGWPLSDRRDAVVTARVVRRARSC